MKYSLGILKNKNLFKRHKYPFQNAHQIFVVSQLQPSGRFEYHQTIQSLTSRKWYVQKTPGCGTVHTYISTRASN